MGLDAEHQFWHRDVDPECSAPDSHRLLQHDRGHPRGRDELCQHSFHPRIRDTSQSARVVQDRSEHSSARRVGSPELRQRAVEPRRRLGTKERVEALLDETSISGRAHRAERRGLVQTPDAADLDHVLMRVDLGRPSNHCVGESAPRSGTGPQLGARRCHRRPTVQPCGRSVTCCACIQAQRGRPQSLLRRTQASADRPDLGPKLGQFTSGPRSAETVWRDANGGCLVRVERVVSRGSKLDKPQSGVVEVHGPNVVTACDTGNASAPGCLRRSLLLAPLRPVPEPVYIYRF